MSKIFFFLNYIYFHAFLQPISSVPQKLIRVPYFLSRIHTLIKLLYIIYFALCGQLKLITMPVSHLNLITFSQKYIPAFIYTIFLTFDVFKAGIFLILL